MFSRLCATIRSRLLLQLLSTHLLQSEGFLLQERLWETIDLQQEEGHKVWLLYSKRGCVKTTVPLYILPANWVDVRKMPEPNSAAILILTCLHLCENSCSKKKKKMTLIWSFPKFILPSEDQHLHHIKPSLGEKSPDACGGGHSQVMTAPND